MERNMSGRRDDSFRPEPVSQFELQSDDEESTPEPPRLNRGPTVKYDMHMLREINVMEQEALDELVALYQVESEDDLPVDVDMFKIIETEKSKRRQFLADLLADCPSSEGSLEFINKFLDRLKEFNSRV